MEEKSKLKINNKNVFEFQPKPEAVRMGSDPSASNSGKGWMVSSHTLKSSPHLPRELKFLFGATSLPEVADDTADL